MKTIIVHHRSSHHAKNSGYGRLTSYLNAQIIYGSTKFPFRIAKIFAKLYSKNKGDFNVGSLLKIIELYQLLNKTRGQKNIVHFLNGERDIRHLGFLKRRFPDTYFCATFHKPPGVLKKTITKVSALKKLDGVITVGTNQVEFIKEWLQLENVVFIPHGVDTLFFVPNTSKIEKNNLLFVGQHLRDFDAFNYCIPKIAKRINDLEVNVIIHPAYINKIHSHKCIKKYSNISDKELLDYYHKASLFFLPLSDVTACNSLLEALSCGLPIITTDVGGNMEYLKNTNNILAPSKDRDYLIEATIELLNNDDKQLQLQKSSREKALDFDWKKVTKQITGFYSSLQNK